MYCAMQSQYIKQVLLYAYPWISSSCQQKSVLFFILDNIHKAMNVFNILTNPICEFYSNLIFIGKDLLKLP